MRFRHLLCLFLALASPCLGRSVPDSSRLVRPSLALSNSRYYCAAYHHVGKLGVYVDNMAAIDGYPDLGDTAGMCYYGPLWRYNGEYPIGSYISYLYSGGLWVGGIIDDDTLVSTANIDIEPYYQPDGSIRPVDTWEFRSDPLPFGNLIYRSSREPERYPDAVSEEDFLCYATDTFPQPSQPFDYQDFRLHKPLHIRVDLNSYAWSMKHTEDFIMFDWAITNIGTKPIRKMYIGLRMDNDIYFSMPGAMASWGSQMDDLGGLLKTAPTLVGCPGEDTFDIAWIADNDGQPYNGQFASDFEHRAQTAVAGTLLLGPAADPERLAFNWWITNHDPTYDFGPRSHPTSWKPFYKFPTGGLGTPQGDRCRYYQMSNEEIDYDQVYMPRIGISDLDWEFPPPYLTSRYATGGDVRYLLSTGPFDLEPGESAAFPFAFLAGENFHRDPTNLNRLKAGNIEGYLAHLDFSDLIKNARTAQWVFDNPGFDTDNDGYFGEYRLCALDSVFRDSQWIVTAAETTWYKGDGVPDWRAAQPPPAPVFWVTSGLNSIHIRFNGLRSETTKDLFTRQVDFEGYRIYIGRDEREASLSTLASYDRLNFDKWVYRQVTADSGAWELDDIPLTLDQVRCRYGRGVDPCNDTTFYPLDYSHAIPFHHPLYADSFFFFVPHEHNAWQLGLPDGIKKIYPDAPRPPTLIADSLPDSLRDIYLTPDKFFKYYEYEYTIENLLPTVPYYINVTAFDFGAPKADLPALETSKTLGLKHLYPLADRAQTDSVLPAVYTYPNPYYSDGRYAAAGFEDRSVNRANSDRNRLIHFVNVPASCIIHIYTLDGDLVRALKHDIDPADPNAHHATWDLINRNIQSIVSGIYYWTVEGSDGKVQMGKFVIIR